MKKNFDKLRSQMSKDRIARSSERAQKMFDERSKNQKEIKQQERKDCAELRASVLEGYQDILAGRVYKFDGNLQGMLDETRKRGDLKKTTAHDPIDSQVYEGPSLDDLDQDRDQSPMRDADI